MSLKADCQAHYSEMSAGDYFCQWLTEEEAEFQETDSVEAPGARRGWEQACSRDGPLLSSGERLWGDDTQPEMMSGHHFHSPPSVPTGRQLRFPQTHGGKGDFSGNVQTKDRNSGTTWHLFLFKAGDFHSFVVPKDFGATKISQLGERVWNPSHAWGHAATTQGVSEATQRSQ